MTSEIVLNILNYIDKNLYNNISIDTIANTLCYDKSYLMKLFKREIGISIISYVNYMKIVNSISLFDNDDYLLKVCMNSGYNSLEYYSEMFKMVTGVNPTTYKKYLKHNNVNQKDLLLIKKFLVRHNIFVNYIDSYRKGIKDTESMKLLLENKVS